MSLHRVGHARLSAWAGAIIAWCSLSWGVRAYNGPPQAPPEVLVLVVAGQNGTDQVAVSYAGAVSEARARADLRTLLSRAGWRAHSIANDTERPVPSAPAMTTVSFSAPVVVPYPEGMLPVAPLIEAYRHYRSLTLLFRVERPYRFLGPPSFESGAFSIRMRREPGAYHYDILVRNPRFKAAVLPEVRPQAPPAQQTGRPSTGWPRLALLALLTVAIAAGIGTAVYLVAATYYGRATTAPSRRR